MLASRIPLRRIIFVTGNQKKLDEVKLIMGENFEIPLETRNVDLPEVQGPSCEYIIQEKCLEACSVLQPSPVDEAVVCEDTSLCFNALKSLPGAYVKWFLTTVGPEGLHSMLHAYDDKSAYAQCIFAFYGPHHQKPPAADNVAVPSKNFTSDTCKSCNRRLDYDSTNVRLFTGRCQGNIVTPRGKRDFGWDPCFEPHASSSDDSSSRKTFAEMSAEEKNCISHRYQALNLLKVFIQENYCLKKQ